MSQFQLSPPVLVIDEYEPIYPHTDLTPFCDDSLCPCHTDLETWQHEIIEPIVGGLLTDEEGRRLFHGKQV